MTGKFVAEMLDHELDGFRHVAEIGGAVGAEAGDVFGKWRMGFTSFGPSPAEQ